MKRVFYVMGKSVEFAYSEEIIPVEVKATFEVGLSRGELDTRYILGDNPEHKEQISVQQMGKSLRNLNVDFIQYSGWATSHKEAVQLLKLVRENVRLVLVIQSELVRGAITKIDQLGAVDSRLYSMDSLASNTQWEGYVYG